MARRNPLGMVSDAAVGVIATGVRAVASLINSAAGAAKGLVGKSDEAAPKDTIESAAAAAVEREMQQEIPAAGPGTNPDTTETDLHQRDTEPLLDPSTVKAVKSETDTLRAAADIDKS